MVDCGFRVSYTNGAFQQHVSNNCQHAYSALLDVVFIRRLCICPFTFKTKIMPPEGSYIRAMCVLRNSSIPIQRCSRHLAHEFRHDNDVAKISFMRCHHPNAVYETTTDGHVSIVIPLGSFINEDSILSGRIETFEFQCSNNCVSQKQKSPLFFIVTLEKDYVVLSRQSININVSASPGRDMKNWEKTCVLRNKSLAIPASTQSRNKKRAIDDGDSIDDSTSSDFTGKQGSFNKRVREGLEALEVVPRHVIEYYKQLRDRHTESSHPHSWPICTSCYQHLDITMFSASSEVSEKLSTRYTLKRTFSPLKCCMRCC